MAWFGEFRRRLAALARREQIDADLEAEMQLHLELRAQEQTEAGANPDLRRCEVRYKRMKHHEPKEFQEVSEASARGRARC